MSEEKKLVSPERIENAVLVIRGEKVLLDADLALFYDVEVKALNQAVKRNIDRFPEDFAFQLTEQEFAALAPHASNDFERSLRSQTVTSKKETRGGRRYAPYAFTEQGVAFAFQCAAQCSRRLR